VFPLRWVNFGQRRHDGSDGAPVQYNEQAWAGDAGGEEAQDEVAATALKPHEPVRQAGAQRRAPACGRKWLRG
jgi:hypothetical protein